MSDSKKNSKKSFESSITDGLYSLPTLAVHSGEDRSLYGEPSLTAPIYQTATFSFANTKELCDFFEGRTKRTAEYGRYGNPTQRVLEKKLAAIEGAEDALMFPSGMNAITTAILALLKEGDEIIFTDDCYRRSRQFANVVLKKFGINHQMVAPNAEAIEAALSDKTKLIITESPTNPYLNVVDLKKLVEVAKKNKVKTLIDSTFATPFNQRPLEFGIDLVTHSTTKYLSGHNDVMGGVVAGKEGLIGLIKDCQSILGGVMDPHACYMTIRGLKTFPIRMERQNQNAQAIAEYLAKHDKVERVHYPGLKTHGTHDIAKEQMLGFGGIVSFEIKGDIDLTSKFIDSLNIPIIAPSLGGVESLIEQPALMSFYELTTEQRLELGIKNNLVRMAVGVESATDLINDLEQGLANI